MAKQKPGTAPEESGAAPKKAAPKEVMVKVGGVELPGIIVSKRKVGKDNQVFVKLSAHVSRWVNEKDVIK